MCPGQSRGYEDARLRFSERAIARFRRKRSNPSERDRVLEVRGRADEGPSLIGELGGGRRSNRRQERSLGALGRCRQRPGQGQAEWQWQRERQWQGQWQWRWRRTRQLSRYPDLDRQRWPRLSGSPISEKLHSATQG